jgi:hypothetical protein
LPPASAVEIYPNWVPALDEEGEPGQDETTIRPDDEQRSIGPFTIYTAADAKLPNGRIVPALIGQLDATFLHKGEVDVIVVYDGRRRWRVSTYDHDHSWARRGRSDERTRRHQGFSNAGPVAPTARRESGRTSNRAYSVPRWPYGDADRLAESTKVPTSHPRACDGVLLWIAGPGGQLLLAG